MKAGISQSSAPPALVEILHSIEAGSLGANVTSDAQILNQLSNHSSAQDFTVTLREEPGVELRVVELESAGSWLELAELIESRLVRDVQGRSTSRSS